MPNSVYGVLARTRRECGVSLSPPPQKKRLSKESPFFWSRRREFEKIKAAKTKRGEEKKRSERFRFLARTRRECGVSLSPPPQKGLSQRESFFWSRRRESDPPKSAWEADAIPLGDACMNTIIIGLSTGIVKRFFALTELEKNSIMSLWNFWGKK